MESEDKIKSIVKKKYAEVASGGSCCSPANSCCEDEDISSLSKDYSKLKGYNPDADLGLGCGVPTEFAAIKEGDTVVDLGSGAGNDVFVARSLVGEKGKVIGLDMTVEMINKARKNNEKLGFNNVEFRLGDIDNMPVSDDSADVIISNCVLNLVPDKKKAFAEIYRVLKPGGHFSISDIVVDGSLPESIKSSAEMIAGCIAGAVEKKEYIHIIGDAGFENVVVQKEYEVPLPDSVLNKYLKAKEAEEFRRSRSRLLSVNVYAEKPL